MLRLAARNAGTARAVLALGLAQCVLWGVLYYAFGVVLKPMTAALRTSPDAVIGAFSAALGSAALAAPAAGRLFDRGHAARVMRPACLIAAVLVAAWALTPSLPVLYAVWVGLGLCMAFTLYEAAYALVASTLAEPAERARAWAGATVLGGLASAVFVPVTHFLEQSLGWRTALLVLATLTAAAAFLVPAHGGGVQRPVRPRSAAIAPPTTPLAPLIALLTLGAAASTIVSVTLFAELTDRGVPAHAAALVLATIGLMQLPGRLWLASGGVPPVGSLVLACAALQGLGLLGLALGHDLTVLLAAAASFGLGMGLTTLARPLAIAALRGEQALHLHSGTSARSQNLARAVAPYAAAQLAPVAGGTLPLAALLGLALLGSGVLTRRAVLAAHGRGCREPASHPPGAP